MPGFASSDWELNSTDPADNPVPLGISLNNNEWNTIEMTIDPNSGVRNYSVINSSGTSVSPVNDSSWSSFKSINGLAIRDVTFGASYTDNIVVEGFAATTQATVYTWRDPGTGAWDGDWFDGTPNWSFTGGGSVPNSNAHTAIFGSAITKDSTVAVDASVTLNRMEFDDDNTYAIAGLGTVTLQADPTAVLPTVAVAQGNHQLQVKLALADDTTITVVSGSLDLNNEVDLNGNTLTLSGAGAVNINHSVTGATGTVTSSVVLGTAGTTSIGGDLTSTGTLAIDLGAFNTDFFDVAGNATLSGILDVTLEGGFTPAGDYTVLTAGSLSAGGLTLDASDTATFSLNIVGNSLVLSAASAANGDFDLDGDVDGLDFLLWQRGGSPNPLSASDLELWESDYGTTGLLVAAAAAVPEPSAIMLLSAGAIFGLSWATRR